MKIDRLFVALTIAAIVNLSCSAVETNATELVAAPSIEPPAVEACAFYSTMKVERGQVENDESVFGYEVELEWYGLFGGVEACYDMTDVEERRGRFNEIESFAGYGCCFGDLEARLAYVYKACAGDEPDTQAVEMELGYETPWITPFAEVECDTCEKAGALYCACGLRHCWHPTDFLAAVVNGSFGFGNPYRNDACFECDRWACREIHLGGALEIEVCSHLKLVPTIDFYDYFTEEQRRIYDKFNGFVAVAGCHLAVDF